MLKERKLGFIQELQCHQFFIFFIGGKESIKDLVDIFNLIKCCGPNTYVYEQIIIRVYVFIQVFLIYQAVISRVNTFLYYFRPFNI
ncbi:hypothetical protein SDC9_130228 [bioreactor metagenome]|uniref:Uncharacterized protein n=1 Tax=bioreactor metagenome TaxID=1076179 RepID=A0A645D1W4_9ZZZZ